MIIAGQFRAPGLVRDRRERVAEIGGCQRHGEPDGGGRRPESDRWHEHQHEAQRQRRHRDQHGPHIRSALLRPIDPGAKERVDECIGESREQQHRADDRQRKSGGLEVELRHQHVHRQGHHRQRRAEQAVGRQPASRRSVKAVRGGGRHVDRLRDCRHIYAQFSGRSRLARSWGALVRGSSQMAKNARPNSGSVISPRKRPSR